MRPVKILYRRLAKEGLKAISKYIRNTPNGIRKVRKGSIEKRGNFLHLTTGSKEYQVNWGSDRLILHGGLYFSPDDCSMDSMEHVRIVNEIRNLIQSR